jgi:hypothetical protein
MTLSDIEITNVSLVSTDSMEQIYWKDQPLAYIIHTQELPQKTTFLTPPEFKQQVGFIVYPQNGEVARHTHRALQRQLCGTSEVLFVLQGACYADIYNDDHDLVASRELIKGDMMLMVGGGHGFRMNEDTVFLEVKQGPYIGVDEKIRF